PLSARSSGTLLFARSPGLPVGYYTIGAGAPLFVSPPSYDIELNAVGQVMTYGATGLVVSHAADPLVVDEHTQIGGARVISLYPFASLNDLGQVAFVAALDDGNSGVFLASPTSCDTDQDGWCNSNDNCPALAAVSQRDSDADGVGDLCDNCPFQANPDQLDSNGDGRGNACLACSGSSTTLPICGTRAVAAGSDSFTLPSVPLQTPFVRPGLRALAISRSSGLAVDVQLSGCSGGQPTAYWGPLGAPADGDGVFLARVIDTYTYAPDRVGATCPVTFTSSGAAGSYDYVVEMTTLQPVGGKSLVAAAVGAQVHAVAPTPDAVPDIEEAHNHRFLYAGTGLSDPNFGTCQFDDNQPTRDDPFVTYSGATASGWDCCTFQFDGVDEIPSSVGQLVFNLNGPLPPPDPDGDGFLSPCDSCDYRANVDQKDGGGIGTTTPDLIGDACQCGQLAGAGSVDAIDVAALRNHLAKNPALSAAQLQFCSVIGGPTECTIRTATVLRRALATPALGPFVSQTCQAALP
ncbi:MAG: thrombospondin type 3 repeat-containing protein, partial [Myxococcota bacterium]